MRSLGTILLGLLVGCSSTRLHDQPEALQAAEAGVARSPLRAAWQGAPSTPFVALPSFERAPEGRFVLRRSRASASFVERGFALALSVPEGRYGLRCELEAPGVAPVGELPAAVVHHAGPAQASAATYERLSWPSVRPGVDMVAEPRRDGFEYGFVVAPGVSLSDLAMRWSGARSVSLREGAVVVETGGPTVRVGGLRAFAVRGSAREELKARFVVDGARVGVAVDGWSGDVPLIVDPVVTWSTYLGGSSLDSAGSLVVDAAGDLIVSGSSASADFPTTVGLDTTVAGYDLFVSKISKSGALVWSTFVGGAGREGGGGAVVDAAGNVYVAGTTNTPGLAVGTGVDATFGGVQDVFVARLGPTGVLAWATYLGGSNSEGLGGLTVDPSGSVWLAGSTYSADFPIVGGFDTTFTDTAPSERPDAFVAKIGPSGALSWSTFLGDTGRDEAVALRSDASGAVVVLGTTTSTAFPTTAGLRTTIGDGGLSSDLFVTKISGSGTLLWSTFFGGNGADDPGGLAVDAAGNVFLAGSTRSTDLGTAGAWDSTINGPFDAFVGKLDAAGKVSWATYLGSPSALTGREWAGPLAIDARGDLLVGGQAGVADFPVPGGFDTKLDGTFDAFVAKFASSGALLHATFLGGTGQEALTAIAVSGAGDTWIAGNTTSTDFPVPGGFDSSLGGTDDVFVARLPNFAQGAACAATSECAVGECVDGVCCDKPCGGPCEACSALKKGAGVDGVCGPVAADTDPKAACSVGTGACAADGLCDGAGKCRSFAKAGASCGADACSAGKVARKVCKGDSSLCLEVKTSCAPFACAAGACKTSCALDGDCDAAAFCAADGLCRTKAAAGESCTDARTCASGFCVDGVCCSTSCGGQCERCDGPTKGSCAPTKGVPAGGRPACGGAGSVCAGSCDGVNGGACSHPVGKECSARCSAGAQTLGLCSKDGACLEAPAQGCNGFVCDGATRCRSWCANSDECSAGFRCQAGACEPIARDQCTPDESGVLKTDGTLVSCGDYRCSAGKCFETCTISDQCAGGRVCSSGVCAPPAVGSASDGGCAVTPGPRGNLAFWLVALGLALAARRRVRH